MKHGWILMILACTGANAVEQRDYPARPVREFIELAKAKPDEIRMGSAGIGATSHLVASKGSDG